MLQAFIITLREGVEASLIIGIVFAYLSKIDRHDLKKTVYYALGSAVAASIVVAVVLSRLQLNPDVFEGWIMLVAAAFTASMIWFMNKTARSMKGEIEAKIQKVTGSASALGLFLLVFLLVLREGVETVLILAAVSLNSTELLSFIGTALGITVAVVFGVMFIRGSVKINLKRFFSVTSVILYFVTFQLLVSGLHELSENGILPSSAFEMRLIGPIVRNDLFFFVTMLALAALMILMEQRRRAPAQLAPEATAAERRKAEWSARREKIWATAVVSAAFLFIFLSTAEFIYAKSTTSLSETAPVTLVGDRVTVPVAQINDGTGDAQLHRFGVHVPYSGADGASHAPEVRFLLYRKPDGNIVSVADACQICGPVGFYVGSQGIVCKMCASPLNAASMGQPGGCNPIPLRSSIVDGQVIIAAADLKAIAPKFVK
jgi:high-affinity iron transporter